MDIVKYNALLRKHKSIDKSKQRRHSIPNMSGHDNPTSYTARVKSAGNMTRSKSVTDVTIATGDIVLLGDQVTMVAFN